jgi:hypothetical protein
LSPGVKAGVFAGLVLGLPLAVIGVSATSQFFSESARENPQVALVWASMGAILLVVGSIAILAVTSLAGAVWGALFARFNEFVPGKSYVGKSLVLLIVLAWGWGSVASIYRAASGTTPTTVTQQILGVSTELVNAVFSFVGLLLFSLIFGLLYDHFEKHTTASERG